METPNPSIPPENEALQSTDVTAPVLNLWTATPTSWFVFRSFLDSTWNRVEEQERRKQVHVGLQGPSGREAQGWWSKLAVGECSGSASHLRKCVCYLQLKSFKLTKAWRSRRKERFPPPLSLSPSSLCRGNFHRPGSTSEVVVEVWP